MADLFISEYVEGSSNNKAIELFNSTGTTIDLAAENYRVEVYSNGNTAPSTTINLVGTVASGDVFVLANSQSSATILAVADQTGGVGFNGNDAIVLKKGDVIVDSIGQIGLDPGTEWGTGNTSTHDNTLRRKSSFTTGDPNPTDLFDPALEWEGFPMDTFSGLGSHTVSVTNGLVVTNTHNSGAGSLRDAIAYANAIGGGTILFAIPEDDPGFDAVSNRFVIQLTSALPAITAPVVIDGYSQPLASENTQSIGYNGAIKITLDGSNAGVSNGLELAEGSSFSTIQGLEIRNFQKEGLLLLGNGNTIRGNIITANGGDGIQIGDGQANGSSDNAIGGVNPGDRNIISGNGDDGIDIKIASFGNTVQGNYIGTTPDGTQALGNAGHGIQIDAAASNVIGGTTPGSRNVIAANAENGVMIANQDATDNRVMGNFIGTDASGIIILGNGGAGVAVVGASNNTIGGTQLSESNVIVGNSVAGVAIADLTLSGVFNVPAQGNAVLGNLIHSNDGLEIDLGHAVTSDGVNITYSDIGVTANDPGDGDTGANQLQNFPVITGAELIDNTTFITGTLNSNANSTFRLEFFADHPPGSNNPGEAQTFLGVTEVTTDANGHASFNTAFLGASAGQLVTATATRVDNGDLKDTSEFSSGVVVQQASAFAPHHDFNGDGQGDILIRQHTTGAVNQWQMNGGAAPTQTFLAAPGAAWTVVAIDDFNADTKADILIRNQTTGAINLWQMDGSTTSNQFIATPGTAWQVAAVENFDGDGQADILIRNQTNGAINLWRMDGATRLANTSIFVPGLAWTVAGVDDFNGDGRADILIRNQTNGAINLLQTNGAALIANTFIAAPGTEWEIADIEDFDGDTKADILIRNQISGTLNLWRMDGAIRLSNTPLATLGVDWLVGEVADFDGDDKADVLVRNQSSGGLNLLKTSGEAVLSNSYIHQPGAVWQLAAVDDYTGDGKVDILLRHTTAGAINLLEMNGATIQSNTQLGVPGASWEVALGQV